MYITKTIAEQVAKELIKTKQIELQNAVKEFENYVEEKYLAAVPKDLLDAWEKHKNLKSFNVKSYTSFDAPGIDPWHTFNFWKPTVSINTRPKLNANEAKKLLMLENRKKDLEVKLRKLEGDLVNALVNIKTYKNCEKVFPKAFPLLPTRTTTALAINLNEILAELN